MAHEQVVRGAIKRLLPVLVFAVALHGETIFPGRDVMPDGRPVHWFGTTTAFVGYYTWPDHRAPLTLYNSAVSDGGIFRLVTQADYPNVTCDVAADTCTIVGLALFSGLPDRTEVKFVTTDALPGGLRSWKENENRVYYIRESSGKTFKLAETPDGPPIDLADSNPGRGTHGMSFAGYAHAITFIAAGTTQRFTVDPGTDVLTSETPHGWKDNIEIYVHSTEALPRPLQAFSRSRYTQYCLGVLNPMQVQIRRKEPEVACKASNAVVDLTDAGTGTFYVYTIGFPAVNISSITGYPQGTVLTWRRGISVQNNTGAVSIPRNGGYGSTENLHVTVFAKVPAVTPPGEYTIRVTTNENRANNLNANAFEYTLYTVPVPNVDKSGPRSYPPIPGLSTSVIPDRPHRSWENMMIASTNGGGSSPGGAQHNRCASRSNPEHPWGVLPGQTEAPYALTFSSPSNAQVWFYNDETFFEIAKYTGDPTWANCGVDVARVMRDKFLGPLGATAVQAYFYFPWTMVAAYRWTGDPSYKDAVIAIADGGNHHRGDTRDLSAREHAFAFERRLARRAVTGTEDYGLQHYADAAIGMLYINAAKSPERTFNEPFILGLLMRPLIRWYMISNDERVPLVVKLTLDRLWDEWYDKSRHRLMYNPEAAGMRCSGSCAQTTGTGLNNLISPAFAWYWRLTGDDKYRERGDDLFAYVWADGNPYYAKEWSQGFYWSWDFVRWRSGEQQAIGRRERTNRTPR